MNVFGEIIHDGSWRKRQGVMRDGHAEPWEIEAYLKQYGEVATDEPARSGVSAVAVEALMNNVA